jgi:hypothetical protein
MPYVVLSCRGAVLVAAVSFQTVSLAHGDTMRVIAGAFAIGCLWYVNAGSASHPPRCGWLAYAVGSSLGAGIGLWVGGL